MKEVFLIEVGDGEVPNDLIAIAGTLDKAKEIVEAWIGTRKDLWGEDFINTGENRWSDGWQLLTITPYEVKW